MPRHVASTHSATHLSLSSTCIVSCRKTTGDDIIPDDNVVQVSYDVVPVVSPTCPVFVVGAQAMEPLAGLAQRRRARDVGLACWEGAAK